MSIVNFRIIFCIRFFLIFPMALSLSFNTLGHHGEAAHYDASKEIVVEAVLTDFHLVNPHAYVYFDVQGEDGEAQHWRCELGTNLKRFGWTEQTLAPGGRVRVTGTPARREEHVCKINSIEHEDGRTIGFRGTPTEGTSTYRPSAEQLAFVPAEKPEIDVLAKGTNEAASRKIVDVPREGFFGYWQATGQGVIGIAGINRRRNQSAEALESDLPMPTSFAIPEYSAEGQAVLAGYDERFDNPSLQCYSSLFDGMVHHGIANEFVQESDERIRWVFGFMDLVRTIHLGQPEHPKVLEPSRMGHSIGHWEGETLVVDTRGFRKQWLYNTNQSSHAIASDQLHVIERLTHDVENDQLIVEYTATDPLYWESPLSGVMRLSRSANAYQPYECVELAGDNNRRADGTTIFD